MKNNEFKTLTKDDVLKILQKQFPTLKTIKSLLNKTIKLSRIERIKGNLIATVVKIEHLQNAIFIALTVENKKCRLSFYGKDWFFFYNDGGGDRSIGDMYLQPT